MYSRARLAEHHFQWRFWSSYTHTHIPPKPPAPDRPRLVGFSPMDHTAGMPHEGSASGDSPRSVSGESMGMSESPMPVP